jgi:glucokinase
MTGQKKRCALGIDFGGTSIKLGVVDEKGRILGQTSFATREAPGVENWLSAVEEKMAELRGLLPPDLDPSGIGVGVPGFTDFARGVIHDLTNVPGWTKVPLAEILRERFGVPSFVDNDVNAMALGECTFGAGRVYEHAVFVTLGTGVGGGLLINNKLYRGAYSMAGEIGHISVDMNGIQTERGRGGLEEYIGNQQIVDRALAGINSGRASTILDYAGGGSESVTVRAIAQAAQGGDALAVEVFDFVADCLAAAFASVTYLLQPQVFIVGGGVSKSGAVLFDPLRKHLAERLSPYFAERIEIKEAELGNDAGMVGSAMLALMAG